MRLLIFDWLRCPSWMRSEPRSGFVEICGLAINPLLPLIGNLSLTYGFQPLKITDVGGILEVTSILSRRAGFGGIESASRYWVPRQWRWPCPEVILASRCWQCGGNAEGSIDHFDEVSFFAKNDPFCLRHREVLTPFRIRFQARSIRLIRSQAVEGDQTPCNIIRSFVRQKIPDKMSAASRNDAAPILGVLLERLSLERIDLVAYDAHYPHWCPLRGRFGQCIAANSQRRRRRHHVLNSFAATYVLGCRLCWLHTRQYASCLTGTLRLTSKYECRRSRGRDGLRNCRGHRSAGARPHALLPGGWPRTNEHRACDGR